MHPSIPFLSPCLCPPQTPGAVLGVANVGELKKVRKARKLAYTELGERLKRSVSFKEVYLWRLRFLHC
ncbi:hypothetical protein Naga_102891g1 [Nannochloropsis gaditana]|uniref:Uncharacterized protein n=1 Tax=Nannochloropsis gaditana TaxID=72520 RepID=W7TGA9_9STRA|nr:hypothetical protein Naga_102891g1 [Nannochloropsis gaditana]